MKNSMQNLDVLREIDGFPIGTDEAIAKLSEEPFYTACPNENIRDFIKRNGKVYDSGSDNYKVEPFAYDVSEGKTDPIYMAHSYHTKVPHKAIMQYILHYTKPGDIVFDGFCGTGMTGVAAQMCGCPDRDFKMKMEKENPDVEWGCRKAILNDISPAATFIAGNYNKSINCTEFAKSILQIIEKTQEDLGWVYETIHNLDDQVSINIKGRINYVIWSDVFICPNCGEQIVYWDMAVNEQGMLNEQLKCTKCNVEIKKAQCQRAVEMRKKQNSDDVYSISKQVPVLINYTYGGERYNKSPDSRDYELMEKINNIDIPYWYPTDKIPVGEKTSDPIKMGITNVDLFYTKRNLYVLSAIWEAAESSIYKNQIRFCVTSILIKTASKLHNVGIKNGKLNLAGAMPNALYIPSILAERNIIELLKGKIKDILPVYSFDKSNDNFIVSCGSSTDLRLIPDNSIDYIFVDPPFGSNLMYSELSFIWEAWLGVITNNKNEAIMSRTQKKGLLEYQELFENCFKEFYRCIKPNRWITIEFHNSKNNVWMAINEAIQKAGFLISYVKTLDKGQGSYNQQTASGAVKQDLAISAYKPSEEFERKIKFNAGTEETVWTFVEQYLDKLPIINLENGVMKTLVERQSYLLYDRMVAYHIMNDMVIPLDAAQFYMGLSEHFIERDNMFFLSSQINEYDTTRIKSEFVQIQYSLFVTNEKSAIAWLYQTLETPMTYGEIHPLFVQEIKTIDKYENIPDLSELLEENFLQDEANKWYIPDRTKEADLIKLRERRLLKVFERYYLTSGKLKSFRIEAIKIGFAKLWKEKEYKKIVLLSERLPDSVIQEDDKLLMYYDISLGRI